jgi:hypothetical protein
MTCSRNAAVIWPPSSNGRDGQPNGEQAISKITFSAADWWFVKQSGLGAEK